MVYRTIEAKYAGKCRSCGKAINVGDTAYWDPDTSKILCEDCGYAKLKI